MCFKLSLSSYASLHGFVTHKRGHLGLDLILSFHNQVLKKQYKFKTLWKPMCLQFILLIEAEVSTRAWVLQAILKALLCYIKVLWNRGLFLSLYRVCCKDGKYWNESQAIVAGINYSKMIAFKASYGSMGLVTDNRAWKMSSKNCSYGHSLTKF